eukprot:2278315-Rhodomonas_salina.1
MQAVVKGEAESKARKKAEDDCASEAKKRGDVEQQRDGLKGDVETANAQNRALDGINQDVTQKNAGLAKDKNDLVHDNEQRKAQNDALAQ